MVPRDEEKQLANGKPPGTVLVTGGRGNLGQKLVAHLETCDWCETIIAIDSILLCIVFHASSNAITALGFAIPRESGWWVLLGPCLNLLVGALLLFALPVRSSARTAANWS